MFPNFKKIVDLPWTMTYVIRKRQQIDSYRELPREKRPPELMIWWGSSEEIDRWFDRVFDRKGKLDSSEVFIINESEIE